MMGPELIFVSLAILLVLVVASVPIGIALGVASVIGAYLADPRLERCSSQIIAARLRAHRLAKTTTSRPPAASAIGMGAEEISEGMPARECHGLCRGW